MRCENVTCILKELEPETVARILGVCGVQTTAIILGKMYSESVAKVVGVMAPETVRLYLAAWPWAWKQILYPTPSMPTTWIVVFLD